MVGKSIGTKPARSTAKTKAVLPRAAKTSAKAVATAGKATKSQASAGPQLNPAQLEAIAKSLSAFRISLSAAAKTPDQHADAGIVGLAQKHAEQGDQPTVGSLMQRLSNWARDHHTQINSEMQHLAYHALKSFFH